MSVKNDIMLISAVLFLLTSCMNLKQPSPEIKYLMLEYESPVYSNKEKLPVILKMDGFRASPIYKTNNIVYRKGVFQRDSYTYHRWGVNPAEMVTYLIGRDLKNSGIFKGVLMSGERNREAEFRVGGILDEFYELYDGEGRSANLTISVTLMPEGKAKVTGSLFFQKTYKIKERLERRNPSALADALSRAMQKASRLIAEDLYLVISQKVAE